MNSRQQKCYNESDSQLVVIHNNIMLLDILRSRKQCFYCKPRWWKKTLADDECMQFFKVSDLFCFVFAIIYRKVASTNRSQVIWFFSSKTFNRRILICCLIVFFSQFCGKANIITGRITRNTKWGHSVVEKKTTSFRLRNSSVGTIILRNWSILLYIHD